MQVLVLKLEFKFKIEFRGSGGLRLKCSHYLMEDGQSGWSVMAGERGWVHSDDVVQVCDVFWLQGLLLGIASGSFCSDSKHYCF